MVHIKLTAIGASGETGELLLKLDSAQYFVRSPDGYTSVGIPGEDELRVEETIGQIEAAIYDLTSGHSPIAATGANE